MKRRKFFALTITLLLVSALLFAGGGKEEVASGKRVLRVSAETWQVTKIFLEEAAESFMARHPDVVIEIQHYADPTVISNYSIEWAAGKTPVDLVVIDGAQFVQQFVAKNLIYDFEKDLNFFSGPVKMSDFVPSALEMSRINGVLYSIPLISEVTANNINLDAFKAAGLVDAAGNPLVPNTWEEFHDFAKKMTIKRGNEVIQQGATIQWGKDMHGTALGVLQAVSGTVYGSDGVTINFDTPEFRKVMGIWKEGIRDGSFSIETFADYNSGRNSYKAGKVAMLLESGSRWVEAGIELGFDKVTVLPLPGSEANGSTGYVNAVFIPRASKVADIAVQFIQEELLGEFVQVNTLNEYGKLPTITKYFDQAKFPDWANLKNTIAKSSTYPAYQDSSRFLDELRVIIQDGLSTNESVDTTINKLNKMIASLVK